MRRLRIGRILLTSAICLTALAAYLRAEQNLSVAVLSGRPEMVSGGSALVQLTGPSLDQVRVVLNGQDVTRVFRPGRSAGTLVGKLDGLRPGENLLEARAGAGRAQLRLKNHPISGPVFSGPHQQPFICQTEYFGLGKAVDANCNAPTRVQYFYRSTKRVSPAGAKAKMSRDGYAPGFEPLPAGPDLPADVAATTTTDGRQLKFIVRVETGTINRGVYRIAFLHQPGQPLPDPWTSAPGWNGRLVYVFGGGCRTGFRQGQAPPPADVSALGAGYAVAGSTLDVYGTNANDVINAEALMMAREYFIKTFGVPVHTIGTGGSGGSIQQYTIAQNYPGLLDGIIPGMSFPDLATTLGPIVDCVLLARVSEKLSQPLTADQRLAIAGYGSWGLCEKRQGSEQWVQAGACEASMPKDKVYDAKSNPQGVRCSLQDNQANVFGRDPKTGAAPQIFDNTGVQYGLHAFNEGKISADQFLDLNERIGGFDADGNASAARSNAGMKAVRTAYETGRVNSGAGGLAWVPIIDTRRYGDPDGNPHDRIRSIQARLRLERTSGSAGNQVLLINPARGFDAIRVMDNWLDRIAADTSSDSPQKKAARNRPGELQDACWGPNEEKIAETASYHGAGRCNQLYPAFADPRIVAGAPVVGDILKCALKPVDPREYRQPLTGAQMARLKRIFPEGTCDYTRPGIGQANLIGTWISY